MLHPDQLTAAAQRLAAAASKPTTVIVLGFYARGDATEESDLDLVVVQAEVSDKASEYLRLKAAVGRMGVGVDLILFARPEFERRSLVPDTLPYWAKREGKVLYDATA